MRSFQARMRQGERRLEPAHVGTREDERLGRQPDGARTASVCEIADDVQFVALLVERDGRERWTPEDNRHRSWSCASRRRAGARSRGRKRCTRSGTSTRMLARPRCRRPRCKWTPGSRSCPKRCGSPSRRNERGLSMNAAREEVRQHALHRLCCWCEWVGPSGRSSCSWWRPNSGTPVAVGRG